MANRTMQQKTLKLKRQLRKLPRRFTEPPGEFTEHSGTPIPARMKAEGVKAPQQPNRDLIRGYKHRAKSLARDEEDDNETLMRRQGYYFENTPPGKKEAQQRRLKMMTERLDETDMETRRLLCVSKFMMNRRRG